nr:reverse transcriptase domain-containing protein [Tanacetum cinerariifolium]
MTNTTPIVTIVTKPATNPRDADATPRLNIQDFCEEYYEDILPIIMDKVRRDKRKEVHTRDHPRGRSRPRRLDASNKDCREDMERFRGVEESYDHSFSHSYHDRDCSRHMKRRRDNESPLSAYRKVTPVTEGAAGVWFDELPPESVDSYKDLKAVFLAYFMQQKKYVKDPIEIHNIKKKDGETIEDFMEQFKVKTGRMKGPPNEVAIRGTLSAKGRTTLCSILKENLDIFAWQPSDMTGVPRSVAEHRLNIREGYSPVRQKKKGQAPERAKATQAELAHVHRFHGFKQGLSVGLLPLPEIDWKVESLCGYPFKYFLDAYKGYHQIQLAESDEEKTAFHIGQCLSASRMLAPRTSGYLKNAGAMYQRLVDKAFDSQIVRNIEVYTDHLVVKSHTEAEMLRDIDETFRTLRKINMKLNPKKCTFGAVEEVFLGYAVAPEGIKSCPDKTAAVLQLPSPRTIKEVQSLNGKLASLNRFLSKSAEKSLPLFKTLKKCIKKSNFHWTAKAEQAFKQLKQHLSELPLLVAPKPKEELIVYLFATYRAISAVLMTKRGEIQMPVYFISRALQGPELNYTPMEKLALSLVFAAKRLRRTSVKGQVLSNFLSEMPDENPPAVPVVETQQEPWTFFTDGSSCVDGSGAGLIVASPEGTDRSADGSAKCTCDNRGSGRWIDVDDTNNGVFKRKDSSRRKEGGKKALHQGPTVRIIEGGSLQAVIPYAMVKVHWTTPGGVSVDVVYNDEELRLNLDLLEERHEQAAIREAKAKLKMTKYYNARVHGVTFRPGDFVYRGNDASHAVKGGKLGPKWEVPYEVKEALGDGAYKLRSTDGTVLLRTWNIANLKRCCL